MVRCSQAVLRRSHQLPDQLGGGEQGAGRLLLDPLHVSDQIRVPGEGWPSEAIVYCNDPLLILVRSTVIRANLSPLSAPSHQISLCQGFVGCLLDPVLVRDKLIHSGAEVLYYEGLPPAPGPQGTGRSPDTSFYQWVPLVLVIQAGIFYIPRRIWKSCEGGLMTALSEMMARMTLTLRLSSQATPR